MVAKRTPSRNAETLDLRVVRAALTLQGRNLGAVARAHGVSRQLVDRIARGQRAGVRGKSAAIRRELLALTHPAQPS